MPDEQVCHAEMHDCIRLLRAELAKQRESLDIAIRNVKNLTDANQDLRDEIEQLKTEGGDDEKLSEVQKS